MIKVNNLVKRYGDLLALDHFSMDVNKGEIFGLLGPNGSGKTTAINCILSLLKYDKGDITILGEKMTPHRYDIKRKIGVVMQSVAVFNELTVRENIDYFCGLYIDDKAKCKQYVDEAIEFVGLNDFTKFFPKKLSGGLLRRLNIACGVAHKPEIIFLDEPTVAVDPQSRNNILEGIKGLNEAGSTIIYTTHYMEEVEQICSRIMIMDNGKAIATGTKEELKNMIHADEKLTAEILYLPDTVLTALLKMDGINSGSYQDNLLKVSYSGEGNKLIEVLRFLQESNITFGHVFSEPPTLNDVFLEITGKNLRD